MSLRVEDRMPAQLARRLVEEARGDETGKSFNHKGHEGRKRKLLWAFVRFVI
jgi:hypothetical protein